LEAAYLLRGLKRRSISLCSACASSSSRSILLATTQGAMRMAMNDNAVSAWTIVGLFLPEKLLSGYSLFRPASLVALADSVAREHCGSPSGKRCATRGCCDSFGLRPLRGQTNGAVSAVGVPNPCFCNRLLGRTGHPASQRAQNPSFLCQARSLSSSNR